MSNFKITIEYKDDKILFNNDNPNVSNTEIVGVLEATKVHILVNSINNLKTKRNERIQKKS